MSAGLKWAWRGLIGCFALIVGWSIHHFVIRRSGYFGWDEACHILKGVLIAHDVRNGDWLSFLYDTYKQVYWPPLHSWLVGFVFLFSSPGADPARTVSTVFFLLGALTIYLAALQLGQRRREVAATVATVLFLTAPPILPYAGLAMLEVTGLFCVSLTAFIYIWLNSSASPPVRHVWLGIAMCLAYFAKTNYGVVMILVWVTATWSNGGKRALFSRESFYVVLPLAIAFAIWFAYPPKIRSTINALVNVSQGEPYTLEGFLFFPKVILHFFGSIWQSLIPVVALFVAFRFWRNPGVRFLLLLALVQFGLGLVHHTREDRHIFPMLPAMVLITGFVLAQYWDLEVSGIGRWLPRLAAIGLCVAGVILLPTVLRPFRRPDYADVVSRIAAVVSENKSSLILGTGEIRQPSPPSIDWQLIVDRTLLPITHAEVVMNVEEDLKIRDIARRLALPAAFKNGINRVTSREELPAQTRTIYLGLFPEYSYAGNVEEARALVRRLDSANPVEVIVVLTKNASEAIYPFEFMNDVVQPLGFEHVTTETFSGSRDRFDLYRRKQ